MSVIARMIEKIYGKQEMRVLMVGLDASGRTTALYMMKLGEVVTTIPTIGFNVETVTHKGVEFTSWDVGGCDKIRPLWRHYFQNTQVLMMFVDSSDLDRLPEARDELHRMLAETELSDAVVILMANKQDLPSAVSPQEIEEQMDMKRITNHPWTTLGTAGIRGEGLWEALDWAKEAVEKKKLQAGPSTGTPEEAATTPAAKGFLGTVLGGWLGGEDPKKAEERRKEQEMEELLQRWLEQEDEPDEEFLERFRKCELDTWDHRTHLRIAWLYLTEEGRQKGLPKIFEGIKHFIANSPRTKRSRGTTFHETMTYFWVHMVHYAIETTHNPNGEFKTFLLLNPQLANGGMFLAYYTKKLMLNTAEARTQVVLPDKRPLPSMISDVSALARKAARGQVQPMATEFSEMQPKGLRTVAPQDDDNTFLEQFEVGQLDRWNHECLLRVVYLYLARYGRKAGKDKVFEQLRRHEGSGFHFTIDYFWIQIVDFAMAEQQSSGVRNVASSIAGQLVKDKEVEFATPPFALFKYNWEQGRSQVREALTNTHFYLTFYSKEIVYSDAASREMVLPDLKPLPSLIGR